MKVKPLVRVDLKLLLAISFLLLSCLFGNNAFAQDMSEEHPLIPLEVFHNRPELPHYVSPSTKMFKGLSNPLDAYQKKLNYIDFLGTKGAERNQGSCGNCWVWGNMGCLEIMYNKALYDGKISNAQYVGNQKFSINYVAAKALYYDFIENGQSEYNTCYGGEIGGFCRLLHTSSEKTPNFNWLVPSSNKNAGYKNPLVAGAVTDITQIQAYPHVSLSEKVEPLLVADSTSDTNDEIKQKVIAALNDGYPISFSYEICSDFDLFWNNDDEDTMYSFPSANCNARGGHTTVLVGYNIEDSNEDNHYWIVVNSWGAPSNRPNGIFKVRMNSIPSNLSITFEAIKTNFYVEPDVCDNLDNNCNTVADEGCEDTCPNNPDKISPGACGCDNEDIDSDFDGVADCVDECPNDYYKSSPGICGCNVKDTDTDNDGTPDCNDACPEDPEKTVPGFCGCNVQDTVVNIRDNNADGIINCLEDQKIAEVKIAENDERYDNNASTAICVRTVAGKLYCMGSNENGLFGSTDVSDSKGFIAVNNISNVKSFDLGHSHACAITEDGKLYCWGFNNMGEVGKQRTPLPEMLPIYEVLYDIQNPESVFCSNYATCVIAEDKKAYCFGDNSGGRLGVDGPMGSEYTCLADLGITTGTGKYDGTYIGIPLGNISTMAMTSRETFSIANGLLYNYGPNYNGEKNSVGARYDTLNNLVSLSASLTDICVINDSGELYCINMFVNPEDGPIANPMPQKIPLSNVSMVSAASSYIILGGLSSDVMQQFGLACYDSGFEDYAYPWVNFGNDQESHICAVSNGDLYCWGRGNSYGQLGSDATSDLMTPRKVNGATNVSGLATGRGITCYISDGELYCFGDLIAIGLDSTTSVPQRITIGSVDTSLAEEDAACEVSYGKCNIGGTYQKVLGTIVCKPESYDALFSDEDGDGTYDCFEEPTPPVSPTETPTVTPTATPTVEPTPLCPESIPLNIEAKKKGKKKIVITMEGIDKECFNGQYVYQVSVSRKGSKVLYKSKKQKFVTPKLQSGQYKVSYRVMQKIITRVKVKENGKMVVKKKIIFKPVTKRSMKVKIKIKKK